MEKNYKISAIGECLIDCVPAGENELGVSLFGANPGGAPANVLAMFSRLGGKSAFLGKVGRDQFGSFLKKTLISAGIDATGLIEDKNYNTTLAFVHLDEKGDRSFSFYRKSCADIMLREDEVSKEIVENTEIFHFGSVSLTDSPSREATLFAAKCARQSGALISYDPNYRPLLWDSVADAKREMEKGVFLADVIKVSDEEMTLLTGETDYLRGAEKLAQMGPKLVFVTLGAEGAFYYNKNASGLLPTYDVQTVDTTGAGDAFFGAVLWQLKGKSREQLTTLLREEMERIVKFGNAAGSLTTTKKGAIPAMPDFSEILDCINAAEALKREE